MIKLQGMLLKALAKKITWWEAAEITGVIDVQVPAGDAVTLEPQIGEESSAA